MDQTASSYIPMDRRQAIVRGETLSEQTEGTALFADISGFTPLTDTLARIFGPRRGAEMLSQHLNRIYDGLITAVNRFGGSVIGFSGDAITCWFEGKTTSTAQRAVACGLAMQAEMQTLNQIELPDRDSIMLALKVSIATGSARRFLVGNPDILVIDVLAGQTVVRMSQGEHVANKGDVIADEVTIKNLGNLVRIAEWRTEDNKGERFAVVQGLTTPIDLADWPPLAIDILETIEIDPWLLPAVRTRMHEGMGEFLTELRPAVALFLRFEGIDFEDDPQAGTKLDTYVRQIQDALARYDGALIQLTVGDKGSYAYIAFGAPNAHEDDAHRAAAVALELKTLKPAFIQSVQIGISQGTMRTGAYGSSTRRTYGVLGDEVNLAARLMQHAGPGEILGSGHIYRATAGSFAWKPLPPLQVKGKQEPISVARMLGKPQMLADAVTFADALAGREIELTQLMDGLQPLIEGKFAGLICVYGEPGIGKSRLVYEAQRLLRRKRPVSWFTCPTDEILRHSLHPFRHFLREYFDQYVRSSEADNKARFDDVLNSLIEAVPDMKRELEAARSFLGGLVDLRWEASPYETTEPKVRFEQTLVAFRALIVAESVRRPVVVQIEDAQWIDADSIELLKTLTYNADAYPFAIIITSRYGDDGGLVGIKTETAQTTIDLEGLSAAAIQSLVAEALGGDITNELANLLLNKANGNPFFIWQLVLDMRERGILIQQHDGVWMTNQQELDEIPSSINAVLVARLDRLAPQVKAVVQAASVLGHEFEIPVLLGMFPEDSLLLEKVKQAENEFIWSILDGRHYLFEHALLCDAAYHMQLQTRLHELHALAGSAIEQVYAAELSSYAPSLAYHFSRAENSERERYYSRMAGELAAIRFANSEAETYLSRALELTPAENDAERYELLLAREAVYDLQGVRTSQSRDLVFLSDLAERLNNDQQRAQVALRRANYAEVTGDYVRAITAAQRAVELAQITGATPIEVAALLAQGRALGWQANYATARTQLERALDLARQETLTHLESESLRNLGIVAYSQGDYPGAQSYQLQALNLSRENGDRRGESMALNNLGIIAREQNNFELARTYQEQALQLSRETGDRRSENSAHYQLGAVLMQEQDYNLKQEYYQQALTLSQTIGNRRGEFNALNNLGTIALEQTDYPTATDYYSRALQLSQEIGYRRGEMRILVALGRLAHRIGDNQASLDHSRQALQIATETGDRPEQASALIFHGHALLELGYFDQAGAAYEEALRLRQAMGQDNLAIEPLAGLARSALLMGDVITAQAHVETILPRLVEGTLEGIVEPLRIYLACYRVLHTAQDARANEVLDSAYHLLQEQMNKISDEVLRRSFLELVPTHRELVAAWAWSVQG